MIDIYILSMRSCIGVKLRVSVSGASWGSIEDSGELDRAVQYSSAVCGVLSID